MFYKIFIKDWDEIKEISRRTSNFIYRGHFERDWKLQPTLERAANKFQIPCKFLFGQEYLIFREFKSVAKNYLDHIPSDKNFLEWMAILQHYGAPTRLLDFTYSIYIAAFFAFEQAVKESAIWGINHYDINDFNYNKLISDKSRKIRSLLLFDYNIELANKLFDYENEAMVKETNKTYLEDKKILFIVRPDNRNERLAIQDSVFLMPSHLEESLESILIKQFNLNINLLSEEYSEEVTFEDFIENKLNRDTSIFKLIVSRNICVDGLLDLRSMNITSATLFPGLDGQARSLHLLMTNMGKFLR